MINKKIGDRVSRQIYMDDGTWRREGDDCLKRSPRRYGTVRRVYQEKVPEWQLIDPKVVLFDDLIEVEFDDGKIERFFHHGVDLEPETSGRLL